MVRKGADSGARTSAWTSLASGQYHKYRVSIIRDTCGTDGGLSTEQTDPIDPQRRAGEAAEALAAEGKPVTNRAVRERAGVAMTVAAEAARQWNERAAGQAQVPDAPDVVLARFAGIWREADVVARNLLDAEREVLTVRLHASEDEIRSLTKDLSESDARLAELEAALELGPGRD